MNTVVIALKTLQPVAFEKEFAANVHMVRRQGDPGIIGKRRHLLPGAHVGPDNPIYLAAGVRRVLDMVLYHALGRLGRRLQDVAFHVIKPAMIDTADAAVLRTSIEQ